jgi:hypothetical protein
MNTLHIEFTHSVTGQRLTIDNVVNVALVFLDNRLVIMGKEYDDAIEKPVTLAQFAGDHWKICGIEAPDQPPFDVVCITRAPA